MLDEGHDIFPSIVSHSLFLCGNSCSCYARICLVAAEAQ